MNQPVATPAIYNTKLESKTKTGTYLAGIGIGIKMSSQVNKCMDFTALLTSIYLLSFIPSIALSFFYYFLSVSLALSPAKKEVKELDRFPFVTIQIPVYNDAVIGKSIQACLEMDYPKDRYEIVVADDSTDPEVIAETDKYLNHPQVKIIRRTNRSGFKAGALNNAMKYSNGDIIVLFDSDFIPPRNFLKRAISHFRDPKVAVVQGRWRFFNLDENIVSVFASLSVLSYQYLVYPVKDMVGTPLLSGSSVVFRKDIMEKVGGWTPNMKAEDMELGLRIIANGYKIVFDPELAAHCQAPFSISSLVKQQMRWTYGGLEAFKTRAKEVFSSKHLSLFQKVFITFIVSLNFNYMLILFQLLAGLALGILNILPFGQMWWLIPVLGGGYFAGISYALSNEGNPKLAPKGIIATLLIGVIVSTANTYAIARFFAGKELPWYVTKKHKA